jgi:hypothetical protein
MHFSPLYQEIETPQGGLEQKFFNEIKHLEQISASFQNTKVIQNEALSDINESAL